MAPRGGLGPGELLRRYTARVARHPGRVLALEFGLLFAVVGVIVGGGYFEITQESGRSWLIPGNREVHRQDAVRAARKLRGDEETASFREREANGREIGTVYLIYRSRTGNMLTPDNLRAVRDVEAQFTGHELFPGFCQLEYPPAGAPRDEQPTCAQPMSLVRVAFDSEGELRDLAPVLEALADNLYLSGFYLSKEFSSDNLQSSYVRSMIPLGAPLAGYERPRSDRNQQAKEVYDDFLKSVQVELHPHLGLEKGFLRPARMSEGLAPNGDVEVLYWSDGAARIEMNELSQQDFLWAVLSMLCVATYMAVHTRSAFISVVGMLEIILSIPLAFFVYRLVFQIRFFSFMHILAVFVLLGIGADDVFVFVDAFKQSSSEPGIEPGDLDKRIEYAAFRASKAVLLTSLTTTAAFLATAISEILPISTFGIFAALCIGLLYLLNVLLMPPTLVIWVRYFGGGRKPDGPKAESCEVDENGKAAVEAAGGGLSAGGQGAASGGGQITADCEKQAGEAEPTALDAGLDVSKLRKMENFFHLRVSRFVHRWRMPIILGFLGVLVVGAIFTARLSPPKESESFFPKRHQVQQFLHLSGPTGPFLASDEDEVATIDFVWGLRGMDQSRRDKWDPGDKGTLVLDENFDPSSAAAQLHMRTVCEEAKSAPCYSRACLDGALVRRRQGLCFTEGFQAWLEAGGREFPTPPELFRQRLLEFYRASESKPYREDIGFVPNAATAEEELKYLVLTFNSTFRFPQPLGLSEEVFESWEGFTSKMNAAAPEGMEGYQTTRYSWMWLATQRSLVKNAVTGVSICFVLAFLVINVATGNWIVSLCTTITIVGIVCTTMGVGVVAMMGYPLGISEAIAIVILIGFSMDYVLHLAGAYVESKRDDRLDRIQDALTTMGISITAGAVTTLLSGIPLFFAVITFFTKFGFFIFFTICVSFLWAILFFSSVMSAFGPSGDEGKWSVVLNSLRRGGRPEPEQ